MEINKRDAVKLVYMSASWARKVNAMPENQVTAIYLKFKERGLIK